MVHSTIYLILVAATKVIGDSFLTQLHQIGLIALAVLLSYSVSRYYRNRQPDAIRTFWATVLTSAFVAIILEYSPTTTIVDFELGIPLNIWTALHFNLVQFLSLFFGTAILFRFQVLINYKRSHRSIQNWHNLLWLMLFSSLSQLPIPFKDDYPFLAELPFILVIVWMLLNAFKLSWIVTLNTREKLWTILLSASVPAILIGGFVFSGNILSLGFILPDGAHVFSLPLLHFIKLTFIFGTFYSITTLLSLIFHIPTSSDFQKKVNDLSSLQSFSELVGQALNAKQLYTTIVSSPAENNSLQSTWLALPDIETGTLKPQIVAVHNISLQAISDQFDVISLYEEATSNPKGLLLSQTEADHRIKKLPDGIKVGSLIIIPLKIRNQVIGALFATRDIAFGFEDDDIQRIRMFTAQAALAIDNANLFEQQLEKERLSKELAIARDVQQKLLPQSVPQISGLRIAASSVSAKEVGGDYYDFVALPNKRLGIIIGDVSGKGTSAAFYMAEMKGIFQALSRLDLPPAEFLALANDALKASLEKNVFISAVYAILDARKEEITLARAGHCPVIGIDINGEKRFFRTDGVGLGIINGQQFKSTISEITLPLSPGDVFTLYTDGVVESRNDKNEEYGYDRLADSLQTHRHEDAKDLHDALLTDLHDFLGIEEQYDDDMTLVVLKWNGLKTDAYPIHVGDQSKKDRQLHKEIDSK